MDNCRTNHARLARVYHLDGRRECADCHVELPREAAAPVPVPFAQQGLLQRLDVTVLPLTVEALLAPTGVSWQQVMADVDRAIAAHG